jgi:hypothetical protein
VPLIYRKGGREVSGFKGKEGLVVRRGLMLLSKEYKVAAGILFYKIKGEKHCVMRKTRLGN